MHVMHVMHVMSQMHDMHVVHGMHKMHQMHTNCKQTKPSHCVAGIGWPAAGAPGARQRTSQLCQADAAGAAHSMYAE